MSSWLTRWLLDERKVLLAILLNAAVLFVLCFSQLPRDTRIWLDRVDDLFTVLFFAEMVVKMRALGVRRYFASNWNAFDFVLVAVSVPSLVFELLNLDIHSNVLLAMRVGRAFKFFRSLRFVPGIDTMLEGIQRALKTSLMLLIGFAIGLFLITVLSCKLFGEIAPEHYGDPIRSLYSTFKIFTVEGWFEVPDEVASRLTGPAQALTRLFFSGILLVCGVLGLSLVNSVFVDAMVADNNDELENKVDALRAELRQLRQELLSARGGAAQSPSADVSSESTPHDPSE